MMKQMTPLELWSVGDQLRANRPSIRIDVRRTPWALLRLSILVAALLLVSTACMGDKTEVAREVDKGEQASPTALAEMPQDINVARITIKDGAFSVEEVIVQQAEPSILNVENQDGRAYRFEIDDIVAPTDVAANTTTRVAFTAPKADRYTGKLLAVDSDAVIAQITVDVSAPGAVAP